MIPETRHVMGEITSDFLVPGYQATCSCGEVIEGLTMATVMARHADHVAEEWA